MLFYDSDDDACMLSHFSRVRLFETPWTIACQAPLSMDFSRQEYWSGFPCPPSGDLPNPGVKHRSPILQADSLPSKPKFWMLGFCIMQTEKFQMSELCLEKEEELEIKLPTFVGL